MFFSVVIIFLDYSYINSQKKKLFIEKELIFYKIEYLTSNFLHEILNEYNKNLSKIKSAHLYLLNNLDKNITQIQEKFGKNFHIFITDKNLTIIKTTFKYDKNFSLNFLENLLKTHKSIHISPPICEPATTDFISYSDLYKNGIVTQIGYVYKTPKIEYFKNEIKKIKEKYPFIKNISLYFIHPKTSYAQYCNILTPLHKKPTKREMLCHNKKGMEIYKELLRKNPLITCDKMYILSYNPFEKDSYIILQIDISKHIMEANIKKTTRIIIIAFVIIAIIAFSILILINRILKSLNEFKHSIINEQKYEKKPIKELKDTIEAYNNTLEKLKKAIESKDDFIHFAMHELATPISILTLYMDEYEDLKPAIKKLLSSYKNLSYCIQKTSHPKRETDLTELIEYRIKFFREILNHENKKVILDLEQLTICANPEEMEILIDNNLKNAIKYSKSDIIKIRLKNKVLEFENEGFIKDKEKIFEKFYREENIKGGFGLGLHITKVICENHNIKIKLIQKNGKVIFQYDLKDTDENCSD
ncbi:sensor histidine kinase [Caminibacter pacificus]